MFAGKRFARAQRTHLLSAARSELFNRVLAVRVRDRSWNRGLEGDVWMLDSSRRAFGHEPWSEAVVVHIYLLTTPTPLPPLAIVQFVLPRCMLSCSTNKSG